MTLKVQSDFDIVKNQTAERHGFLMSWRQCHGPRDGSVESPRVHLRVIFQLDEREMNAVPLRDLPKEFVKTCLRD